MARDFEKDVVSFDHITIGPIGGLSAALHGAAALSGHSWVSFDALEASGESDDVLGVFIAAGQGLSLKVFDQKIRVSARSQSADSIQHGTGTTILSTGTWYSFGGAIDIAGDAIRPYLNGVQEGGGAVTFGATSWTDGNNQTNTDAIGTEGQGSGIPRAERSLNGRAAEIAIWNKDIGDAGFAQLADGFTPLFVETGSLIFYRRLVRELGPDEIGDGFTLAVAGSVPVVDHPPKILYPAPKFFSFPVAVLAGQPTQKRSQGIPTASGYRDRPGRWN